MIKNWILSWRWFVFCAGLWSGFPVQANDTDVLDGLSRQWIELRSELARERAAWTTQSAALKREFDALKRERDGLAREAEQHAAESTSFEEQLVSGESRRAEMDAGMAIIQAALDRAEHELRSWPAWLTPDIKKDAERQLRDITAMSRDKRRTTTAERWQRIVALVSLIESRQQHIHVERQMVQVGDDVNRLADVLYLGLAAGYAVSPDGSWAAVGMIGDNGWIWTPRPEWATAIRRAIAMAQKQELAGFVALPLQVVDHE
ncbi:MAG TPA: DUF3450 family protein [Kiritimatiellia bacterium]|nr:DUF3450 family protein [Kiritimatiellia bacterium]